MINLIKKILCLIEKKHKKEALVLVLLMFIGMLLETLGIGLIIPALAIMTQSDIDSKYPVLQPLLIFLGKPDQLGLVTIGMLVLASIYTVKVCFLAFFAWKQAGFSFRVQVSLSQRLFQGYMELPYTFHLQRNSSELIRNVLTETSLYTNSVNSVLIILTEGMVFIGICTLLLFVEPLGAVIVVSIIGVAGLCFHLITKNYILKWGEFRQNHEGKRILHLQQGFGGVKEAKLLGREAEFLNKFRYHNETAASANRLVTTLKALPRHWLELLAVISLVILVLLMLNEGRKIESILPMLGLFAAAAFRVIPLVNRILSAFQSIRYAMPSIDTLHSEMKLFDDHSTKKGFNDFDFSNVIGIKNVSFTYPDADAPSLNSINLEIKKGTTIGLIGTTGSGKSTLVDIILGLLEPDDGKVCVDNKDINCNLRGWQNQIGYVPQNIFLTDDSLRRNIAFGLKDDDIKDQFVYDAISASKLEEFVNELPQGLDTIVGERGVRLSGGQRQRIGIARALYHQPQVLVLDEATSSLDIKTEESVMDAVEALHGNKTIVIIAHRLSTVEDCDHVYQLEQGDILENRIISAI